MSKELTSLCSLINTILVNLYEELPKTLKAENIKLNDKITSIQEEQSKETVYW